MLICFSGTYTDFRPLKDLLFIFNFKVHACTYVYMSVYEYVHMCTPQTSHEEDNLQESFLSLPYEGSED